MRRSSGEIPAAETKEVFREDPQGFDEHFEHVMRPFAVSSTRRPRRPPDEDALTTTLAKKAV
jgi:hypothetical protein